MNDFDRKDLEHILKIMDYCYLDGDAQKLGRKIQSMIDNYCGHEVITADMKECQAICVLNEDGKTYFTLESDTYPCGTYASLDLVMKIICILVIGENKFSAEWIDRIMFRLQELKNDNQRKTLGMSPL